MNKETPRTRIRFGFEKTQMEKLQCEIDTDLFQGRPVLKLRIACAQTGSEDRRDKGWVSQLTPS